MHSLQERTKDFLLTPDVYSCTSARVMDAMDKDYGKPFGVRPEKDVAKLIERAMRRGGEFRSVNRLANEALRAFLSDRRKQKVAA